MTGITDRGPSLRLELKEQTLTAWNVRNGAKCLVAREVDEERIRRVNAHLCGDLGWIRRDSRGDPAIRPTDCDYLSRELYKAGLNALCVLLGEGDSNRLDEIQSFFSACLADIDDLPDAPPILDFVSDKSLKWHVPLEALPVFGKVDIESGEADAWDVARVLPGYRVVLRRTLVSSWRSPSHASSSNDDTVPFTVRVFYHNRLAGALRELKHLNEIAFRGHLSVVLIFPPERHRMNRVWPELELVKAVAEMRPNDKSGRLQTADICHFSCHLFDAPGQERGPYLELRSNVWWGGSEKYFVDRIRPASQHVGSLPRMIFLNTCRSGVEDLGPRTSAADAFAYLHPHCMIGTLADIPDMAAAEFCREFYNELAQGSSVGVAIRLARLTLLRNFKNPFGLLFTSYFGEDTRFSVRGDRWSKYIPDENRAIDSGIH